MKTMTKKLIAGLFSALAMAASTTAVSQTVTYFHNDASGSPIAATDASGNLVWKEAYTPYGMKTLMPQEAESNRIGFAGKPYDNDTQLSYMGARYYDPNLARFISVDPKPADPENVHGINRYAYANNNPYRFVDPDGHSPIDVVFLAYDLGKLGVAMYTGVGVNAAIVDVAMSVVGVASPIPGTGQAMKAARAADKGVDAIRAGAQVAESMKATKGALDATKATSKIDRAAFAKERADYWKREAQANSGKYAPDDVARMEKGRAPIGSDGFPMELHHKNRTMTGGVEPMTRTEHRLGENYKKNHPE